MDLWITEYVSSSEVSGLCFLPSRNDSELLEMAQNSNTMQEPFS